MCWSLKVKVRKGPSLLYYVSHLQEKRNRSFGRYTGPSILESTEECQ